MRKRISTLRNAALGWAFVVAVGEVLRYVGLPIIPRVGVMVAGAFVLLAAAYVAWCEYVDRSVTERLETRNYVLAEIIGLGAGVAGALALGMLPAHAFGIGFALASLLAFPWVRAENPGMSPIAYFAGAFGFAALWFVAPWVPH